MAHQSRIGMIYFLSFCLCFVRAEDFDSCETNSDCQEGQFCYESSKICASCVDCGKYHRKKPNWTQCPEEPLMCGVCLDGFQEEILTKGEKRDGCLKIMSRSSAPDVANYSLRTLDSSISPEENETLIFLDQNRGGPRSRMILVSVVCACAVVCIAGVSFAAIRHRNKRRVRETTHELGVFITPDSPPPYSLQERVQLSTDVRPTIEISASRSQEFTYNVDAESLQKAHPFRIPDYHERREENVEPEMQDDLNLHEEDTMPSSWTPHERREDNASIPDEDSELSSFDRDPSDPRNRTPTLYTSGVTRVETVNLEGGTASVNNVNANTNSITLNISHFAVFNEANLSTSRSTNSSSDDTVVNGNGALSGSVMRLNESAPQCVPFRP